MNPLVCKHTLQLQFLRQNGHISATSNSDILGYLLQTQKKKKKMEQKNSLCFETKGKKIKVLLAKTLPLLDTLDTVHFGSTFAARNNIFPFTFHTLVTFNAF